MNRVEFFTVLTGELSRIQPSELQDVLRYYNEYFDDAGAENEQAVLEELGSPWKIAEAIRETSTMSYIDSDKRNTKRSFKALWVTLISVFALPIGLPIALALFIVLFSLIFVFFSLVFCLYLTAFVLALVGSLLTIFSFFTLTLDIPTFIFTLGSGLVLTGLGVLLFIPTIKLSSASIKGIVLFINRKIFRRG